ncbi:sialidase [Chitinophaga caeni]|uniref:Sialidase n=2 Tax=Chitinophaga caeni TaxID=2029983 RepID=A0A291QSV8_9BACT|nr:sialidase [Chitinophaga caeni]
MTETMKKFIYILGIAAFSTGLSSCDKRADDVIDEIPDTYTMLYMPQAIDLPNEYTFNRSAAGDSIFYGAYLGGPRSFDTNIEVQFEIDQAKVAEYNKMNFTSYPVLPADSYEFTETSTVIPKGSQHSSTLKMKILSANLDGVGKFLLPITMKTSSQVNVNPSLETTYFLVDAQYLSNPFPVMDRAAWEIVDFSSEEATGEGANNGHAIHAFDDDPATFWTTQWKGAKPGPPHHITINMNADEKVHGFKFIGRIDNKTGEVRTTGNPRDIIVETSMDGSTWNYSEAFHLDNVLENTIYLSYAQDATYYRITINSSQSDNYLTHIAELYAF